MTKLLDWVPFLGGALIGWSQVTTPGVWSAIALVLGVNLTIISYIKDKE